MVSQQLFDNPEYQLHPFISVVIPAFNASHDITTCLEALLNQTYPKDLYEIIIVDNGSSDNTRTIIQQYPVKLLVENNHQSPYAARNLGIRQARGQIIALTDSDCKPIPHWLECAVHALQAEQADLLGGQVIFTFSSEQSTGEMYDSIGNLEMKNSIAAKGVAKTGNLIIKKKVFDSVGLFPHQIRSGGDVLWTGWATRAGFKLVYAPSVQIYKPARKLKPLLKKQYRIGYGQPYVWHDQGLGSKIVIKRLIADFLPFSPKKLRRMINERGEPQMEQVFGRLWLVAWLCAIVTNLGRIHYFIHRLFSKSS